MKKVAHFLFNLEDMLGHPGMARYIEAGYEIITF